MGERDRWTGAGPVLRGAVGCVPKRRSPKWAPRGPAVTLHGDPEGDAYRTLSAVRFGEPMYLPAPFDVTVDTALFPAD